MKKGPGSAPGSPPAAPAAARVPSRGPLGRRPVPLRGPLPAPRSVGRGDGLAAGALRRAPPGALPEAPPAATAVFRGRARLGGPRGLLVGTRSFAPTSRSRRGGPLPPPPLPDPARPPPPGG